MKVGTTIAGMGAGSSDGELGLLRLGTYPDLYEIPLQWNGSAARWVSRPEPALIQRSDERMSFPFNTGVDWTYISQGPDTQLGEYSLSQGSMILSPFPMDLMYKAGLRLQENLSGFLYAADGATFTKVAAQWYLFNTNGITNFFAYPNPFSGAGAGVELTGTLTKQWLSTGWQNSPIGVPGKRYGYPDYYGAVISGANGQGRVENLTLFIRWVGDPTLPALPQPPITSNLVLWADASQETYADGAKAYIWSDRSVNGNNLSANSVGRRPTFVANQVNGKPIMRFDGTNTWLRTYFDNVAKAQPNTIFVVLKQYAGGPAQQVWVDGSPGTYDVISARNVIYRFDGTNQVSLYAGGTDVTYSRGSSWPSPFVCYVAKFNGASSQIWENLTSKATGNPGSQGMSGITIGASGNNDTLLAQIDVAEVLVYNANINDTDRTTITNWLNTKYTLF